jgi:superfamily II DNA/RNA helicase
VLRGGLDRESLRLSVVQIPSAAQRVAWIAGHLDSLQGSGIIYTLTVAGARDLATLLRDMGHHVAAYTGATDPAEREQLESDLLANRVKALVATSALGMGFDKPDLGFVIHLGAPSSPISYYQQVGRAGRATASAEVGSGQIHRVGIRKTGTRVILHLPGLDHQAPRLTTDEESRRVRAVQSAPEGYDTEPRAERTAEGVGRLHDPGLDHHLTDRDIDLLDERRDLLDLAPRQPQDQVPLTPQLTNHRPSKNGRGA